MMAEVLSALAVDAGAVVVASLVRGIALAVVG